MMKLPFARCCRRLFKRQDTLWSKQSNGREGLKLYRQRPADLVIVDIMMPELNGPDTIIELTREFLDIKVIAISGVFSEEYLRKTARLLGARRTLRKPFGIEELLSAVRYELAH